MKKRFLIGGAAFLVFFAAPLYAENICVFQGHFDFVAKKIDTVIRFKNGSSIEATLTKTAEDHFQFSGKIDHVSTPLWNISSVLESTIEMAEDKDSSGRFLKGTFASKYSLINYKPAHELSGNFEIKNGRLRINRLSWGGFNYEGYIDLMAPFEIGLTLRMTDIAVADLPSIGVCQEGGSHSLTGTVSGRIDIAGFIDRVILRGKLSAFNGSIGNLVYENILVNFEGLYPVIHIADSNVTEAEGLSFNIEGNLDLANQCNLIAGLTALKMSPIIDENSIRREWTIKRNKETENSSTEVKYRFKKQLNETPAPKDDADMLSIERKIMF